MFPKWISKDNLLGLSPYVEQGEEGSTALGAFSLPAVLLLYLLVLGILVILYTLATPMRIPQQSSLPDVSHQRITQTHALCTAREGWGNPCSWFYLVVCFVSGFFPVVVTAFHFHLKISKHPACPCRGLLFPLLFFLYLEDLFFLKNKLSIKCKNWIFPGKHW